MSRTILLADDSVTIQKVIELTFMDEDYTVVAVGDGDAALEALDDGQPDVVIADVHMPGADGYDVARHAKSVRPGTPVLLLVGTFEPFDESEYERSGADRYLKKPFDSQELQQIVEELLAGAGDSAAEPSEVAAAAQEADDPFDLGSAHDEEPAPSEPAQAIEHREASASPFSIGLDEPEPEMVAEEVDDVGASQGEPAVADESIEAVAEPERGAAFELSDSGDSGESFALEDGEPPAPTQVTPPSPAPESAAAPEGNGHAGLSDDDVDRIARRVVELMGDGPVRDVAWEVIPDIAESVVRSRLRELESQVE